MRIAVNAFNLPDNLAGIGYYTQQLYGAMAERPDVDHIEVFTNARAARQLGILHPKVKVRGYPLPGILNKTFFTQVIFPWLTSGFDAVHSVGNVAVFACRKPQVVTVHDLCHRTMKERFGLSKRMYLEFGFFFSVRMPRIRFVCDTHSTEKDFHDLYPASRGRTETVHLACKFDVRHNGQNRDGLLFVGTLEPGKNLPLALRALAILKDKYQVTPTLKIVGARGWKQSSLPVLVQELGIGDQLRFMGRIEDDELRDLYRDSACLTYTSLYEGFGFPILEAQSQGCLVVSADNSCLPEIGGDGALYFENDDASTLAGHLFDLLRPSDRASQLRERGYANLTRFSWKLTAEKTRNALQAVSRP